MATVTTTAMATVATPVATPAMATVATPVAATAAATVTTAAVPESAKSAVPVILCVGKPYKPIIVRLL